MASSKISIIIADNQYIAREGLKTIIASQNDFSVVAEVSQSEALQQAVHKLKPNVVIIDYNSPDFLSPKDIAAIKKASPKTKMLVISSDHNRDNIFKVLDEGVKNFLTKECDREEIINAIYATHKNEKFFCTKVVDLILEKHMNQNEEHCEPSVLSLRENEIIAYVAEGYTNKEIAQKLHLSPHTISTHRKNIMSKLRIRTVSEIVMYAIRLGLVKHS